MTKKIFAFAAVSALLLAGCSKASGDNSRSVTSDDDKGAYALGLEIGAALKSLNTDRVDLDLFLQGLKDTLVRGNSKLTAEEAVAAKRTLFEAIQKDASEKTLKEGTAYLEANKKKPGVKETSTGLQYKILAEGSGVMPKDSDKVVVHYTGRLIDGTEFDSSVKRNRPFVFELRPGVVIDGWVEAVKLMKEGSKFEVAIPSELAYKDRAMRVIPPNSVLVFEIELLKVNPTADEEKALMNPVAPVPAPKAEESKKAEEPKKAEEAAK